MKTDTPVNADHEEVEVVAQAYTCAHSHLAKHVLKLKLALWSIVVVLQRPYVTSIKEHRSIQIAKQSRSVFKVEEQLHISRLVEI